MLLRGQRIRWCPLPLPLQEGSAALVCHTQLGQEELNCLALNPSGSLLAAADDSGTVHLLELPSWQARPALQGGHTSICSSVAFSPQHPSQGVPASRQTGSCSKHCHLKFILTDTKDWHCLLKSFCMPATQQPDQVAFDSQTTSSTAPLPCHRLCLRAHAVLSGGLDSLALQWDVEAGQVLARHSTGQYGCPLLLFYIQLWQRCLVLTVSNPFHDIECASATSP